MPAESTLYGASHMPKGTTQLLHCQLKSDEPLRIIIFVLFHDYKTPINHLAVLYINLPETAYTKCYT